MIKENLNLYHIFYETAICGNISMAARKLYISQPAISKAISKLENSLGVSLFVRSSRGVKLTPDGEILLKQLDTAFHAIKQGEDTIESRKESGAGSLSIGISTTLCRYLLLPYLQDFIKAHPEVKLSIFCQSSTETIAALENGLLDMGIIGETSHLDPLHFYPVCDIHDILVATKDYLAQVESATDKSPRDMLSHANLMLLDKRNITRQYIEKYLLLNEITPRQQLE
ncbi:MAG: LysR family transcriptional regulator, partial [Lachnospiraceae bacterium]|nr:LysR family transcriptional regulator [Lachnospiraceae bacterium]